MARGPLTWMTAVALAALPLALAACGGEDSSGSCTAAFSGNFADTVSAASCASFGTSPDGGASSTLNLVVASAVAGAPTHVAIDLGVAAAGEFSSETVPSWEATGINTGNCEFSAGSASVPMGSFTLTLTAIGAAPHGKLSVIQFVKAPPSVDCGDGDTEQIDVTF